MSEKKECSTCWKEGKKSVEIIESRDKHWETNISCARCHSRATGCRECKESWELWENRR